MICATFWPLPMKFETSESRLLILLINKQALNDTERLKWISISCSPPQGLLAKHTHSGITLGYFYVYSPKTFIVENQPDIYNLTLKLPKTNYFYQRAPSTTFFFNFESFNFFAQKLPWEQKSENLRFIGNWQTLIGY